MTGPATTISILIKAFPDVIKKFDKIVIMGSSLGKGNITPYAEFNTHHDPESLKVLLRAPDVDKIIFGLEACDYGYYLADIVDKVKAYKTKSSFVVAECYKLVSESCTAFSEPNVAYDATIMPCIVMKNYSHLHQANCEVKLDGEERGRTLFTPVVISEDRIFVASWLDREMLFDMLYFCLDENAKNARSHDFEMDDDGARGLESEKTSGDDNGSFDAESHMIPKRKHQVNSFC